MEQRRRNISTDRLSREGSGSETGRAIVIGPYLRARPPRDAAGAVLRSEDRSPPARLDEITGLARAIDLNVVNAGIVSLSEIRPATFIGKGKADEIAGLVKTLEAGIVVMDCALSPIGRDV